MNILSLPFLQINYTWKQLPIASSVLIIDTIFSEYYKPITLNLIVT